MTIDAFGGWRTVLNQLLDGEDLPAEVAEAALTTILAGDATAAQIAAFIAGLRAKGETVAELTGMVRAMQGAATRLVLPPETIDIVGMGGAPARRAHALNVSTMACFVASGAGAIVCKHGNRRASSTSGSFDFLEAVGVPDDVAPERLVETVEELGIGFAFARTFHPAMRHAAPVRAELGIASVFNILGPLSHPGRVTRQVVGVSDTALVQPMAAVLAANGAERVFVVRGHGELDELSLTGPSLVAELADGTITEWDLDPTDLGFTTVEPDELRGGDAQVNAAIATRIFAGERGPHRDIVVLNAAAGLVVAGVAADMSDGVERASTAIDSGAVAEKLASLVSAVSR